MNGGPGGKQQEGNVWNKSGYTKMYNALKDLEDYNVNVSVPEFVFIGFQSSGKTSAVSQAAKMAVGVMKHGTASRCPTRFKLISNPKLKKPLIKVNGETCRNQADLTNKTLACTKQYEVNDEFSSYLSTHYYITSYKMTHTIQYTEDIIEVRIESAQVPELTFVDLPGLIKGDNEQFATAKRQLDELTTFFLHETNPDGSYRYMPILVREPVDVEHDTHHEVTYIKGLVDRYEGRRQRINWRDDTLFIVNKFDKQINRSPAASLIKYMEYCSEYGETVLTIMNARGKNTANMSQTELNQFVLTVEADEEAKWQEVLNEFDKMDDENLPQLIKLRKAISGIPKMNAILSDRMCEIVKKVLPKVERQLAKAEADKRKELSGIEKQIDMCDPQKLKGQCLQFNNKFLEYLRAFYGGTLVPSLPTKWKKTWAKEVDDFHLVSNMDDMWKYEIQPSKLTTLLNKLQPKEKPAELLKLLKMELIASAAIIRMTDTWVCMVAYMSFPRFTDEDIVNISGAFHSTKQADIWTSVRNLVISAVGHLADAAKYLGEMLRYKLKENAQIIFDFTLKKQFGKADMSGNAIIKLLNRTLRDYQAEVDSIIDDFLKVATVVPENQTKILDKSFCEETINIGKLVMKLLNPNSKNKHRPIQKQKNQPVQKYGMKRGASANKNIKGNNPVPPPPGPGGNNIPPPSDKPPAKNGANIPPPKSAKGANPMSKQGRGGNYGGNSDEKKDDSNNDVPYNMQNYDRLFYEAIHGQKLNHPMTIGAASYEIDLIRHLSYTFWTNIKHVATRDIVQKMTNLVMAPINQLDDRVANAIQCGAAGRQLQNIKDALVEKTGIDVVALEKLIEKSSIQIPKAINDLDNKELEEIYGINRETLLKVKQKKLVALKEFRQLKKDTLQKIYYIKNGDVEGLEGQKQKKKKENVNEDQDDVKEEIDDDDDVNEQQQFVNKMTRGFDEDEDDYGNYEE